MLVFDQRPPPGQAPSAGIHALVVGVSAYPHLPGGAVAPLPGSPTAQLGLTQLRAPALTAYRIHRWLLDHLEELPTPLHSVRLLLAPSAAELADDPTIAEARAGGATYTKLQAALNDWRADLSRFAQSMGFFFFSGHGLGGTGDDALMLAADFGDPRVPLLHRAISITDVEQGMAPPPPGGGRTIGRRQVYCIDACRNRPPGLVPNAAEVPTVWANAPAPPGVDDRELAILLATIPSRRAYVGKAGEPTVFGQAVLESLDGAAAEVITENGVPRWPVSTTGMGGRLPDLMAERAKKLRVSQTYRPGRQLVSVRLVAHRNAPQVTVGFPVTGTTPPANLRVEVRDAHAATMIEPLRQPAHKYRLPMGFYSVVARAIVPPPLGELQFDAMLRPPRHDVEVNL